MFNFRNPFKKKKKSISKEPNWNEVPARSEGVGALAWESINLENEPKLVFDKIIIKKIKVN